MMEKNINSNASPAQMYTFIKKFIFEVQLILYKMKYPSHCIQNF